MTELDPDQLLKSLDAELAAAKYRRSGPGTNRNIFRVASIMILVFGTIAALCVLQYMASEMVASRPAPLAQPEAGKGK